MFKLFLNTLFPLTGDNLSSLPKAVDRERLTALAARKEALLEKLSDKMDELKKLCIQEAVSVQNLVPWVLQTSLQESLSFCLCTIIKVINYP